jgi:hypothetical protein
MNQSPMNIVGRHPPTAATGDRHDETVVGLEPHSQGFMSGVAPNA